MPVPHVSAGVSLAVIAGVLVVTTVTSLAASRRQAGEAGAAHGVGEEGRASPVRRRAGKGRRTGTGAEAGWTGRPDRNGGPVADSRSCGRRLMRNGS